MELKREICKMSRLDEIQDEINGYKKDIESLERVGGLHHEIAKYKGWIQELEEERRKLLKLQ